MFNSMRRHVSGLVNLLRKGSAAPQAVTPIISSVRADNLTYLDDAALNDLYQQIGRIESEGVAGCLIEAGCALGGSAIVMAAAKSASREFFVYDVFGMIPPPSEMDDEDVHRRFDVIVSGGSEGIDGDKYYGYETNLYDTVTGNFSRHGFPVERNNVRLVKGLFEDTINMNGPVALAHLDGDWFESVMTCLQRITPHLVKGGVLVIDDYYAWSGCRKAVDAYFADKRADFEFVQKARLNIVRK